MALGAVVWLVGQALWLADRSSVWPWLVATLTIEAWTDSSGHSGLTRTRTGSSVPKASSIARRRRFCCRAGTGPALKMERSSCVDLRIPSSWTQPTAEFWSAPCFWAAKNSRCSSLSSMGVAETRGTVPSPSRSR